MSLEREFEEEERLKAAIQFWESCLRAIFDLPATVIIIHGEWKLGKTDFALFLYEELKRLGIVKKGATNIVTKEKELLCVQNMPYLKKWMFEDTISKLFIYDESIRGTPSRRAMSKLNVAWMQDIIPELSKGKAKLIVIAQETDYVESVFYHPTFLRGVFQKIKLKVAVLKSHRIKRRQATFYDIPRTKIKFDPYRGAPFVLEADIDFAKTPVEQKVHYMYGKGISLRQIGASFTPKKHPEEIKRILKESLKLTEDAKVAAMYGEGLNYREIGKTYKPPKHPEVIRKLLRNFLRKTSMELSPVTNNSARDIVKDSE